MDFYRDTYTSPDTYERKAVGCWVVIVTAPVANRDRVTARSRITTGTQLPERFPSLTYIPVFIFANCHPLPAVLRKMYQPILSGEHMSGLQLGSQLSLCPGGTYTLPADRACDRFAICTRYAQYFAFYPPTCSGSSAQ